jgi:hypothetical protein
MGEYVSYQQIINETRELLIANTEWQNRYAGYATSMLANKDFILRVRKLFHESKHLKLYLSTLNATKAQRKIVFDLRYLGQTVAELIGDDQKIWLSTKSYEEANKDYFGCNIALENCAWNGVKATEFRSYFKKRYAECNKNDDSPRFKEHRIESSLLTEFSKKLKPKALHNIQPVKIANAHFSMPTPLSARGQNATSYAGDKGGGIDILARIRGRDTHLCIIEVKAVNTQAEPASVAIEQAIKHTVFIRELLRSKAGKDWWKLLFGRRRLPDNLTLYAACAMPHIDGADTSFGGRECAIGDDNIQLHCIYFDDANNSIEIVQTSLPMAAS